MKAYSLDLREKIVQRTWQKRHLFFLTNARHPRNHQLKTQGSPGLCAIVKRVSAGVVYFVRSHLASALQLSQA